MEAFISGDVLLFLIIIAGIAWLIHKRLPKKEKQINLRKSFKKKGGKINVKKSSYDVN